MLIYGILVRANIFWVIATDKQAQYIAETVSKLPRCPSFWTDFWIIVRGLKVVGVTESNPVYS